MSPTVSVVIPAWNEAADIGGCLEAIAAQDGLAGDLEVVLADGRSTDETVDIARREAERLGLCMVVVDNVARRTSAGLNLALAAARGQLVARIDARSRIPRSYVATCAKVLAERPQVGVVGGAQVALSRGPGVIEQGIARSLRNRWTTGLSRYRRSTASGETDTVWMGVFRTAELRQLGGWSERVALNEDFDLNQRYRAAGMLVWFDGSLRSGYLPRQTLGALTRQYFRFGRVKGTWWARGSRPNGRQAALLVAPLVAGLVGVGAARRWGGAAAVGLSFAGAAAVDHFGATEPASPSVRLISIVASVNVAASWWTGVVAGTLGEWVGVDHQHG